MQSPENQEAIDFRGRTHTQGIVVSLRTRWKTDQQEQRRHYQSRMALLLCLACTTNREYSSSSFMCRRQTCVACGAMRTRRRFVFVLLVVPSVRIALFRGRVCVCVDSIDLRNVVCGFCAFKYVHQKANTRVVLVDGATTQIIKNGASS